MTIQDVARAAAVSPTSVSNYLNGRMGEMRVATRQRIAQAIKELGYTPNSVARQLKTGNAPIIGLLVPSVVNPYYGELAVAVDVAAQKRGFRVVLCNTQRDPARELDFVRELVAYGVRGILAASLLDNAEAMSALIQRGVAFVLFETPGAERSIERIDVVSMDNRLAAEQAVDYLAGLGHRAMAYVSATPLNPHRLARLHGFRQALAKHGCGEGLLITDEDLPTRLVVPNEAGLAQFGFLAAEHLAASRERPSAVVTLNDLVALGLMSGLLKQGLRIPDDISVVGIDDIQLSSFSYPALTTIRQPYEQIAELAVDSICARLADPSRIGATMALAPTLVTRSSTARWPGRTAQGA